MQKRREDGRFVGGQAIGNGLVRVEMDRADASDAAASGADRGAPRDMRSKSCRTYTRKHVIAALPEIVEAITKKAKEGSVPHTKALMEMGGLVERNAAAQKVEVRWRGKSIAERLLEDVGEEPQG